MFRCQNWRLLVKHLNLPKTCIFKRHHVSDKVKFLETILDFNPSTEAHKFWQKHDYLLAVDDCAVSDSVRYLKAIGITTGDIREQPTILCTGRIVLQNRHEVLRECGCSTVDIHLLQNYKEIVRHTETSLKRLGIIDHNINLQQRLANRLNVEFEPCKEDATLTAIRLHFSRLFFVGNGFMSADEFNSAFRQLYVRHKSYQSTTQILNILAEQLHIPRHKISDYKQALKADPHNLQELLTIKSIGGVNIEDILKMRPDLMLLSADSVQGTVKELEKVGLSGELIMKHTDVLVQLVKLGPKLVQSRLQEMSTKPQIQTMNFHPMFLKLVLYYYKIANRMERLETIDKKCFTIAAITGAPYNFERYTKAEEDKHLKSDCILFLATNLDMDAKKVKEEMIRHRYWLNIPLTAVKHTIDALRLAEFELADIRANIHIVLYSGDLIVNRLKKLSESEQFKDHRWADLPKTVQLKLILYDIELDRHFTGDGVWLDRKHDDSDFSR